MEYKYIKLPLMIEDTTYKTDLKNIVPDKYGTLRKTFTFKTQKWYHLFVFRCETMYKPVEYTYKMDLKLVWLHWGVGEMQNKIQITLNMSLKIGDREIEYNNFKSRKFEKGKNVFISRVNRISGKKGITFRKVGDMKFELILKNIQFYSVN
ncbi:MAG: hypothetical protein GY755_00140 [Chloroflexi bacterium]|nr:hypothetical protein [Chloroflexota bacterium]